MESPLRNRHTLMSIRMHKLKTSEVYQRISDKTGLNRRDVERVVETLLELITNEMKQGIEVVFTGFGSFFAKVRKGRAGVNPKTGEAMQIPSVTIPKFKPGKNLKDVLKATAEQNGTETAVEHQ